MKTSAIALALTLLGCASVKPAFPERYEAIRMTRQSRFFGVCVTPGMMLDASVSFESGVLSGTHAVPSASPVTADDCRDQRDPGFVEGAFTPVQLRGRQLDELRKLIAGVPSMDCKAVRGLHCDWCLMTTIAVADTQVGDFCCGKVNEDFAVAFQALESYLDGLAAGAN